MTGGGIPISVGQEPTNDQQERRFTEIIKKANKALFPLEDELTCTIEGPNLPTIFILGVPRSGTTLMSQLLSHWGGFAYISNFLARYWLTPYTGSMIEQHLGIRQRKGEGTYQSSFGATMRLDEPHEFSYFWRRWFDFGLDHQKLDPHHLEEIDIADLRRAVGSIERAWSAPTVFKNPYWCNFQAAFLAKVFPKSVFIWCQRAPLFVAQSIVLAREAMMGSREKWWSMKPPGVRELLSAPWWEQVAGQVYFTEMEIEKGLSCISSTRVLRVSYDELCNRPSEIVQKVVEVVNAMGATLSMDGYAPLGFDSSNRQRLSNSDFRRLRDACHNYYGATNIGI